jgi:outer membrane protein assembly factor BamB
VTQTFKLPSRFRWLILVLVSILITAPQTLAPGAQAQTDSRVGHTNQTQTPAEPSVAIQQANPQRTGVYPTGPNIQKGEFALESAKLFVIKRGSYESYSGMTIGSGPNAMYIMGGDFFWPYYGIGYSDPVVSGGIIYFSVNIGDGHLFALDARTGERKWHSKREKGSYSPPTVVGDTLYVGADDGYFYAVDLKTVKEKWRHTRTDKSTVVTSPTVADGFIYYTAKGTLYVLDAESGQPRWNFETSANYMSTPIVSDGGVYFEVGANIFCLDSKTGQEKWRLPVKDGLWTPLVVANGLVYFRNTEGRIRTVDAKTGQLQPKPGNDPRAGTRLTIDGQTIYFGGWSSGSSYAIDATTRETKWKFSPEVECHAPVVGGDNIYLTCQDGRLYMLDAATGKRRWATSPKKTRLSSPVITNDAIYFISDDGKVYGVR